MTTLARRIARLESDRAAGPAMADWLAAIERGDAGWINHTVNHPQGMQGLSDADLEALIGIFRTRAGAVA